jgi:hypothetical protein
MIIAKSLTYSLSFVLAIVVFELAATIARGQSNSGDVTFGRTAVQKKAELN